MKSVYPHPTKTQTEAVWTRIYAIPSGAAATTVPESLALPAIETVVTTRPNFAFRRLGVGFEAAGPFSRTPR
jgi:hypothetical protein